MGLEEVRHEPHHLVQVQVALADVEGSFVPTSILPRKNNTGRTQNAPDDGSSKQHSRTDRQGMRASNTARREGAPAHCKVESVWLRRKQKAKGRNRQPSKRHAVGQKAKEETETGSQAEGMLKRRRHSKGQREAARGNAC